MIITFMKNICLTRDIKVKIFSLKYYNIFDDQSLVICDIKSQEDKKFNLQLRFIQNNSKK